jgi:hypothetical protein
VADPFAAVSWEPFGSDDDEAVDASLSALTSRLSTAVPSFLGLTVTLAGGHADGGDDLTLTAVAGAAEGSAQTSLAFSTARPGGGSARFVLYARRPGALVDLQADLAYLGRADGTGRAGRAPADVLLDQDLPAPVLEPGLAGLSGRATLHRAEGALIDEGVGPEHAASELRRRAARAGSDLRAYAEELLAQKKNRR